MHRGAYFAQLRTTAVRKLLPDSWGFMCPVHTPDGSPCGLLTHLAAACRVVSSPPPSPHLLRTRLAQVPPQSPCRRLSIPSSGRHRE